MVQKHRIRIEIGNHDMLFWIKIEILTLPFCCMIQKPNIRIEIKNHDIAILLHGSKTQDRIEIGYHYITIFELILKS